MKPIQFKQQNCTYAEKQEEYLNLPALKLNTSEGDVISCWKMSLEERLKVLFSGKVWLSVMTFHKPLSPIYMTVDRKKVLVFSSDKSGLFERIKSKFLKIIGWMRLFVWNVCPECNHDAPELYDCPVCDFYEYLPRYAHEQTKEQKRKVWSKFLKWNELWK